MEESTTPMSPAADTAASKPVARRPRSVSRPPPKSVGSDAVACASHPPLPWVIAAVAVVAVIVMATGVFPTSGRRANAWSAVFLTTGQVFFGHVARQSEDALLLRDVYYIQVGTNLQADAAAQPDLSLVRLGSELHGPKDEMRINPAHVLFTQDLRDDAPVVQTI